MLAHQHVLLLLARRWSVVGHLLHRRSIDHLQRGTDLDKTGLLTSAAAAAAATTTKPAIIIKQRTQLLLILRIDDTRRAKETYVCRPLINNRFGN